jgi:hypothetical protein
MKQIVATVLMVEDDQARLRLFRDYARTRGDIRPYAIGCTADITPLLEDLATEGESLDIALLDVRVPKWPKEAREVRPEILPPRAADVAGVLAGMNIAMYSEFV